VARARQWQAWRRCHNDYVAPRAKRLLSSAPHSARPITSHGDCALLFTTSRQLPHPCRSRRQTPIPLTSPSVALREGIRATEGDVGGDREGWRGSRRLGGWPLPI
jgi:hypothetical protein